MLVSLTSTTPDARDLGFLLHKHPDRVRSVDVGFGQAHVFYPEATQHRCTATVFVEVDPVGLARSQRRNRPGGLEPYVNDRPYVASSMLSVALARLFRTAMSGKCDARPELVELSLDLEVELPVVPVRGGSEVLRRLFEPLGYDVEAQPIALDTHFRPWGDSPYFGVRMSGRHTVRRALEHLYVLLPVLDDRKHYWIGQDEIDKLLRRGGDWVKSHPETQMISRRYLRFGGYAREALSRLADAGEDCDAVAEHQEGHEQAIERPLKLSEQRLEAVADAVRGLGGGRVVDLGCGEGRLLERLVAEPAVTEVLGIDVSIAALQRAQRRLSVDELSERRRERISLQQGALTYTDPRACGFDIATMVEVIEHVDIERLDVLGEVVFGHAVPGAVVLTTPNREYNTKFEHLSPAGLRHGDHRFEWTRSEFAAWAHSVSDRFGYSFEIDGIGPLDPDCGSPTQMAIFRR